jgi:hypothetical protein
MQGSRFSVVFIAILAAIGSVAPASAQVVVDDFSTDQTVSHSTVSSSTVDEISGSGILGGVRLIRLTQGALAGSVSGVVSGGALTMSTTTQADLEVWWDGVDDNAFTPTGLGGLDLTNGGQFDRFVLDVSANSLPSDTMRLQIWIDGGNRCEVQFAMPVGQLELPFSSFTICSGTADSATASQNAGLILLRTVFRPGAWSFTLGFVQSTPVELQALSVE